MVERRAPAIKIAADSRTSKPHDPRHLARKSEVIVETNPDRLQPRELTTLKPERRNLRPAQIRDRTELGGIETDRVSNGAKGEVKGLQNASALDPNPPRVDDLRLRPHTKTANRVGRNDPVVIRKVAQVDEFARRRLG